MPTEATSIVGEHRLRLAGDILWLTVTAGAGAMMVGIVFWSFSAELAPGAILNRPTAGVTSAPKAGSAVVPPSPTLGISRIPPPDASSTTAGEVTAGSSNVRATTEVVDTTESAGGKSLLRDPIADQQPNPPPADHSGLGPLPRTRQPVQSTSATARSLGPHRPHQQHQRVRPLAPGSDATLAPR
jgi:hypothetical protein